MLHVKSHRTNIYHHVQKVQKFDFKELSWIIENLKTEEIPKTIIFCRNVKTVGAIYAHFSSFLKYDQFFQKDCSFEKRKIAQFHRSTDKIIKDFVLKEFVKTSSKIRVVIATIAFGIGIDIPDVTNNAKHIRGSVKKTICL